MDQLPVRNGGFKGEAGQAPASLLGEASPLRQLLEGIDALFFLTEGATDNGPGRILYVSPAYERIWGRSLESLYADPRSWLEALHPADRSRVVEALPGIARAEFDLEYRIIRRDGEIRWIRQRVFPVRNERGEIYRTAGVVEDITDRKLAESDLSFVLGHARCLLWHAEVEAPLPGESPYRWKSRLFDAEAAERFFPLELLPGESYMEAFYRLKPPEDRRLVDRNARVALEQGHSDYSHEFRCTRKDGEIRWVREEAHLEAIEPGRWRVAALYTDVTERKRLLEKLAEADRRKDEFLGMLGHELRNPLAPILNAARIIRIVGLDEATVLRQAEIIERQARLLARLVDDLLDVSRITQGQIELRKQPLLLAALVDHALEVVRPLIESKRHQVILDLPEAPVMLDVDSARICQVLANLLNNAAKYTDPEGCIHVIAEAGPEQLSICVRDNGIGIPADVLPCVFDLYAQEDRGLTRSQGGLGIGLTVARSLAQMHGGAIEASSAGPGCGSEFTLRLPLRKGEGLRKDEGGRMKDEVSKSGDLHPSSFRLHPLRVLVAEDNRDAAETLAELIPIWGHECRVVHDGHQACEISRGFLPDVVLLDIGLPGLDGYEVARRLRDREFGEGTQGHADARTGGQADRSTHGESQELNPQSAIRNSQSPAPFLVALTGYGRDADRRRAMEVGFDEHLTKPVEPEVLREILGRVQAASSGSTES